jgi:selenide,water dikinase
MDMEVGASSLPLLEGVEELVRLGQVPGGSRANEELVADLVDWPASLPASLRLLLCDAQTSGGLLASLPPREAEEFVAELRASDCPEAAIVGRVLGPGPGRIRVLA